MFYLDSWWPAHQGPTGWSPTGQPGQLLKEACVWLWSAVLFLATVCAASGNSVFGALPSVVVMLFISFACFPLSPILVKFLFLSFIWFFVRATRFPSEFVWSSAGAGGTIWGTCHRLMVVVWIIEDIDDKMTSVVLPVFCVSYRWRREAASQWRYLRQRYRTVRVFTTTSRLHHAKWRHIRTLFPLGPFRPGAGYFFAIIP